MEELVKRGLFFCRFYLLLDIELEFAFELGGIIMEVVEIKKYCISKHKVKEDYPFGDVPICYRLKGKIFAQLYPYDDNFKITLKCTAETGQMFRMLFPQHVKAGYHCPPVQKHYWNTIQLSDFPDDVLLDMIDIAYDTVFNSFSKKMQKSILEDDEEYIL